MLPHCQVELHGYDKKTADGPTKSSDTIDRSEGLIVVTSNYNFYYSEASSPQNTQNMPSYSNKIGFLVLKDNK